MTYFTTSKIFLVPSFELDVKESEKIDKFLLFLENSQVGNVITKYVKNNTSKQLWNKHLLIILQFLNL